VRTGEELPAQVPVVVADPGPGLRTLVEVEEAEELHAGDELAPGAEAGGLPRGERTLAGSGVEPREGPGSLEDGRAVFDRAQQDAKTGRPERVQAGEVAGERLDEGGVRGTDREGDGERGPEAGRGGGGRREAEGPARGVQRADRRVGEAEEEEAGHREGRGEGGEEETEQAIERGHRSRPCR